MLLQANIDLGLESTTAAQNYSTTQINKQKAKNPFSYFCVSFVCNIIWDHIPRLYANKKQQKYSNKIGSDLMVPTWHAETHTEIMTFSRWKHNMINGNCSEQNVFHECWQIKRCCGFYLLKNAILLPMILVEFNFFSLQFGVHQVSNQLALAANLWRFLQKRKMIN